MTSPESVKKFKISISANQLHTLIVKGSSEWNYDVTFLRDAILESQNSLRKLQLCHRLFRQDGLSEEMFQFISDCNSSYGNGYYSLTSETPSTCRLDVPEPYHNDVTRNKIMANLPLISEFLKTDAIFQAGSTNLPELSEYLIQGLRIDMKRNAVILNGEIVPLP